MENNKIKLSEEELASISELRMAILANVETLGRLNIKKHFLQKGNEKARLPKVNV